MVKVMRARWPVVLAILMLAGCQSVPGADGRYATPGRGGWDSFRAEAPSSDHDSPSSGGRENFRAEAPPPSDADRSGM